MNEDFTEEEFEDDMPEGVEFAEPEIQEKPRRMEQRNTTLNKTQKRVAPTPSIAENEKERFTPFITPKRIGVLDNETRTPLMEDQDSNLLLLGLVTKLLNDVDDIKKNL